MSLRFSGLEVVEIEWQSLLASPPNLDKAWFTGAEVSELDILTTLSKLFRSAGLVLLLFSCPITGLVEEEGGAFPLSDAWLNARFMGLFGEDRVREEGLVGAVFERVEERSASFALGGNGTASGDGV